MNLVFFSFLENENDIFSFGKCEKNKNESVEYGLNDLMNVIE